MKGALLKKQFNYDCDKPWMDKPTAFQKIPVGNCKGNDNPLSRKGYRLILSVGIVALMLLLCWNAYVSFELVRLRHDVTAVTLRECSCKSTMENDETIDDDSIDDKSYNLSDDAYEYNSDDIIINYNENSNLSPESRNHSLFKRSAGEPSKPKPSGRNKKRGGKGRRKNRVKQLLRKNKAVAIHVKAKRTTDIFENRINVPGRKLNEWLSPDPEYIGFDTKSLLSDGYVTAPVNGLYFVYSQVVFRSSNLPYMVAEIGVNTWGAAAFTKCQISANPNATDGSYVACHSNGVVYLHKGDGISLIVNPQNVHVYMAPEYTYFGAFLLGLN